MKLTLLLLLLVCFGVSNATNFYVDASTTSSTQNGTSANPWKTLTQVNSGQNAFNPGDIISFKCGGTYTGSLVLNRGGSATSPITFNSYGTGARPKFTGTGSSLGFLFFVNSKNYVVFNNLEVLDPTVNTSSTTRTQKSNIIRAFCMDGTASFCKVLNCKITAVGCAVYFTSPNNTVDGCEIADLTMIVDTPGGGDDYGAAAIVVSSANNTITHNTISRCYAHSYDYTWDGGAVEIYENRASNNFIAYNTISNCAGISEMTGTSTGNKFHYNKLINNGEMVYFQNSGIGIEFYNNVVIENTTPKLYQSSLFGGSMPSGTLSMKNNVFQLSTGTKVASSSTGIVHQKNIYKMSGTSSVGITLDATETSTSANFWTSTSGTDPLAWNYAPLTGSILINGGTNVGLSKDFAGNTVDASPNTGILEASGGSGSTLAVTSSAGIINCNGSTATVTVSATGGTAPYTGTGNFTAAAGTYTYSVTDAAGTVRTTSITLAQPSAIAVTATPGTITIYGGSTSVTVSATGGTSPYTYSINGTTFQSGNIFTGVLAGNKTITVKDSKGCTSIKTFTITQPSQGVFAISLVSKTNVTCKGAHNGTITVTASNGVAPYTYKKNTGSYVSSNYFSNLSSGTYTITAKDATGITSSISVAIAGTQVVCSGRNMSGKSEEKVAKEEEMTVTTITAYPNPYSDYFSLTLNSQLNTENVHITIINLEGKIVEQKIMNGSRQANFGKGLLAGIYFVRVQQDNEIKTLKIVKTN